MADTITIATSIKPAAMVDPMMPSTPTSRADTPVKKKRQTVKNHQVIVMLLLDLSFLSIFLSQKSRFIIYSSSVLMQKTGNGMPENIYTCISIRSVSCLWKIDIHVESAQTKIKKNFIEYLHMYSKLNMINAFTWYRFVSRGCANSHTI